METLNKVQLMKRRLIVYCKMNVLIYFLLLLDLEEYRPERNSLSCLLV